MKKKLLKTLLLAVGLLLGGNSWADTTVGATDCSTALDATGSYSESYTIKGDGTVHFTFVNHNNGGANNENWYLYCANNDKSSEYFRLRADNWEDIAFANTNCVNNFDWDNFVSDMNGATVDMYVSRLGSVVTVSSKITTTADKTYYYSYTYVNASMTNKITVWLGVCLSYLTISTAEPSTYTSAYSYDFNSSTHPFSYSSTNNVAIAYPSSVNGGDGNLMQESTFNADRTMSLSYTGNATFTGATDYVYEFDWNASSSNANANTLTIAGASGTLLTVAQTGNAKPSKTFTASSALATHEYANSRQLATPPAFYHFIFSASSTKGVYLTVLYNKTTVVVANQRIADYTTIASIQDVCGKSYHHVIWDDLSLKTAAPVGSVSTPTYTITGTSGTSRKFTLDCATANTTIYYAASDLEKGDAGWTEYTGEVTTAEATIYAYAKDEDDYTSSKINFETGAGTAITLNAPTFTKTAYSDGVYTVTIASNQSNLELVPTTVTLYYSIDGGEPSVYSGAFALNSGSTVTAYAVSEGYSNSSEATLTAVARPVFTEDWSLDFASQATEDQGMVTIEKEVASFTVGSTNYYPITANEFTSNDNFAVADNNNLRLRTASTKGLYSMASGNRNIAIGNLTKGQYVIINCANQASYYGGVAGVGEYMPDYSTAGQIVLRATADGNMAVSVARYIYIQSIFVYNVSHLSVPVTVAGYATYVNSDYDLNFSTTNIKAYKVKVSTKGEATLTKVDNVPAGTPVLLYKDGGATENIPVMTGATAVSENDLVAGTGAAVKTIDGDYTNMILNNGSDGIGFYFANSQTVAANRAYLHILTTLAPDAAGDSRMMMVFTDDEETTGIESLTPALSKGKGVFYNLNGQRMNTPKKGLYIKGGKKVVVR